MKITHDQMVARLFKNPEDIQSDFSVKEKELDQDEVLRKLNLIHGCMGVSGEAGELLDAIKKHTMYNKPLDVENVVEELGDIEFYLASIRQQLGFTREFIIEENMRKLEQRYPGFEYTDQKAIERLDKKD